DELRRLVASMRLAHLHQVGEQPGQLVAKQLAAIAAGTKTLEGVAKAGVELAQRLSQRGAAIVLQGGGGGGGGAGGGGGGGGADGTFPIGALVLTGPPLRQGTPAADQIQRLSAELGSRLAAARAVYEAEQRAVRDPLTGLNNLREFERLLGTHAGPSPPIATLI